MTNLPHNDFHHSTLIAYVLDDLYPKLFSYLNRVYDTLCASELSENVHILQSQLEEINKQLDETYRKEKLLLFPYVLRAETDNNRNHLPNFDWVSRYHRDISSRVTTFKTHLLRVMVDAPDDISQASTIQSAVSDFESHSIILQLLIEEKLLSSLDASNFRL